MIPVDPLYLAFGMYLAVRIVPLLSFVPARQQRQRFTLLEKANLWAESKKHNLPLGYTMLAFHSKGNRVARFYRRPDGTFVVATMCMTVKGKSHIHTTSDTANETTAARTHEINKAWVNQFTH